MADNAEMVPMDKCGIFTGKSIDEAKRKAADEFQIPLKDISFRVLEDVKKGLFGKIKSEARVWAGYNEPIDLGPSYMEDKRIERVKTAKLNTCKSYLEKVLEKMGIDAEISITIIDSGIFADIDSKGSGAVIGRRGETLDALQYLATLVTNRIEGDYVRVSLDSCGYREKREETLKGLAEKISEKVKKSGRSTVLEPMNPYERRIIHSTVAQIEGVNSKSIGEEPYRKVVIASDNPKKYSNRKNNKNHSNKKNEGPRSLDLKTSFEKDYKKPKPEDDINAGLYGKIEL
ncbi:RNA-binding cell elongation regulator Jag/EloR [Porcipelethomonas sp.]|uniref:RNA-binding cell elongation regulator Jag/EloR n=1 Tax=Porcipelethomonas sp. TaxID=2981675 RepID=UPI003EFA91B0